MSWEDLGWTVGTFAMAFVFIRGIVTIASWMDRRHDDKLG